jgi:hypothetical protein
MLFYNRKKGGIASVILSLKHVNVSTICPRLEGRINLVTGMKANKKPRNNQFKEDLEHKFPTIKVW